MKDSYNVRILEQLQQFLKCPHVSRDMTKPTKWLCAKRRLRSAWASAQSDQSSLFAWRKLGSLATHWVHSKDSDQTRLIWVFAGRNTHFVGFVMSRLIFQIFYGNFKSHLAPPPPSTNPIEVPVRNLASRQMSDILSGSVLWSSS